MQGDQESYLHFMQIAMCEQEPTVTHELGKSEENGREMSLSQMRGRGLVMDLTTDAIASIYIFINMY